MKLCLKEVPSQKGEQKGRIEASPGLAGAEASGGSLSRSVFQFAPMPQMPQRPETACDADHPRCFYFLSEGAGAGSALSTEIREVVELPAKDGLEPGWRSIKANRAREPRRVAKWPQLP